MPSVEQETKGTDVTDVKPEDTSRAANVGRSLLSFVVSLAIFGFMLWIFMLSFNGSFGSRNFEKRRLTYWQCLGLFIALGMLAAFLAACAGISHPLVVGVVRT